MEAPRVWSGLKFGVALGATGGTLAHVPCGENSIGTVVKIVVPEVSGVEQSAEVKLVRVLDQDTPGTIIKTNPCSCKCGMLINGLALESLRHGGQVGFVAPTDEKPYKEQTIYSQID